MTQQPLFPQQLTHQPLPDPAPYQPHSQTSREAAESIAPKAGTLRALVFRYIASRPDGATDEEIQQALSMSGNTSRPRRRELQNAGLVRNSGKVRMTTSGKHATIWEKARDASQL